MDVSHLKYDDSGNCDLAKSHQLVPVLDDGGKVGIYCIYCDYILFEHEGSTCVTPQGKLIEVGDMSY